MTESQRSGGRSALGVGPCRDPAAARRRLCLRLQPAFGDLRKNLGRVILLGLEVLIIADIIRTIVVEQSVESVAVLGIIVVIRVVLSFSLEVEIDGMWPWNQWRIAPKNPASKES